MQLNLAVAELSKVRQSIEISVGEEEEADAAHQQDQRSDPLSLAAREGNRVVAPMAPERASVSQPET